MSVADLFRKHADSNSSGQSSRTAPMLTSVLESRFLTFGLASGTASHSVENCILERERERESKRKRKQEREREQESDRARERERERAREREQKREREKDNSYETFDINKSFSKYRIWRSPSWLKKGRASKVSLDICINLSAINMINI